MFLPIVPTPDGCPRPFATPGDRTSAMIGETDASGQATFENLLVPGSDCGRASSVTDDDDFTADGSFVIPSATAPQPVDKGGSITSPKGKSVPIVPAWLGRLPAVGFRSERMCGVEVGMRVSAHP